jgi:hypothetical protein
VEEGKEGFEGDLGGRLLFGEDTGVVVVGGDLGIGLGELGGVIDLGVALVEGAGILVVVIGFVWFVGDSLGGRGFRGA